jgi:uncharacterized protein (TIGR00255 family)
MPIRSMTGFAQARRDTAAGAITLGLKSVNHRSLDLHFHLNSTLDPYEPALRGVLKRRLSRGHIDIRVHLDRAASAESVSINEPLLSACIAAFRRAAAAHQLERQEPDLTALLRLPGVLNEAPAADPGPELEAALLDALHEAIDELDQFRLREGADLAAEILRHNIAIRAAVLQLEELRREVQPSIEARLRGRLRDLLESAASVDPQRLLQEAALLAERSNVQEELARLRVHSHQLDELLRTSNEAGKRLDFLLQEMNRETNTILSKTSNAGETGLKITELALGVKSDIEKIREQAMNLE